MEIIFILIGVLVHTSEEYFIFKKDKKKQFTKYIEGVPHMCDASCTACNFEAIVV
jgi:hypothetical protein